VRDAARGNRCSAGGVGSRIGAHRTYHARCSSESRCSEAIDACVKTFRLVGKMNTQFRKIVIGIDFSDASLAGARWVSNHLAPHAELLLVHVVPLPRPPAYLHEHIGSTIDQRSTLVPRLYTALRGFADLLCSDHIRIGIRTGVPWSALARVAEEVKADLICVARGSKRQGSSRFGATTPQRLLAISPIPVLVIPQG